VKRGTFPVKQRNRWDRALKLEASGEGMVGHAGAVLLHRTADRVDLVGRLRGVLRASPWLLDRADALVSLIVGIGLGAVNLAQAELLARHHTVVLGGQVSDSTLWRTLEEIDARTREKIGKARARVRVRVWALLAAREAGFPWITVLGKELAGWVVIDMDAAVITAASNKEQATGTFKKTFGHHPPAAWCGNTFECLAMMLRLGNAGSNTACEHVSVLDEALRQRPASGARSWSGSTAPARATSSSSPSRPSARRCHMGRPGDIVPAAPRPSRCAAASPPARPPGSRSGTGQKPAGKVRARRAWP
jgi:hypothetical protein